MSEPSDAKRPADASSPLPADVVRRARRGEPGAFERLYEAYADTVYRFVVYKVADEMLAADLTQDVFVNALRSLPGLTRAGRFEPWLMRIARNRVANHWRSVSRSPTQVPIDSSGRRPDAGARELPEVAGLTAAAAPDAPGAAALAAGDPLEQAERRVDFAVVRSILGGLSEAKQDVIALRFGSGFTVKETATILGRSEDAVKKLQARALADIREAIR